MKIDIKVPQLGESVAEATISRLLVPDGSFVKQDMEVVELETDKVNQVLYAPSAGKITFSVAVGETVGIEKIIAVIDTEAKEEKGGSLEGDTPKIPVAPPSPPPSVGARQSLHIFTQEVREKPSEDKPHITEKKHSPLTQEKEVKAPSEGSSRKKMSTLRKTIAARLVEVKNTTAMLTTFNEVDMSAVMDIRLHEKENFQKKYGIKLGFMSFFVKAVTQALQAFPEVNAYIDGDEIVTFSTYDIGVAVSTDKGLFVPVIRGCAALSFGEIEKKIESFAKKAREGSIAIDDMRGASFTITNGGVFGSLLSTPILNPPQSAILGMHSIVKRPVVVSEQIVIRPMMYLALSYDHRIIDGKEAVLFLIHIKQCLEDPARLLLDV